jgi:hypothetical protein
MCVFLNVLENNEFLLLLQSSENHPYSNDNLEKRLDVFGDIQLTFSSYPQKGDHEKVKIICCLVEKSFETLDKSCSLEILLNWGCSMGKLQYCQDQCNQQTNSGFH